MVICYIIAGIFDALYLGGVNFILMFVFWVCFVLLFVWIYTKYSGEYAEIGEYIDHFSDVIWNNVSRINQKVKDLNKKIFSGISTGLFPMYTICNAFCHWTYKSRLKFFFFFFLFNLVLIIQLVICILNFPRY
jgi:hypothetical protein